MKLLLTLCAVTIICAFAGWVDLVGILTTVVFLSACMFLLVTVRPKEEK